jgi:hypothetical protein
MRLLIAESVRLPGWQLGARPRVGAHLIPLASSRRRGTGPVSCERRRAPARSRRGRRGGCLGAGGFLLLRQPGAFFHLCRVGASLVPVGLRPSPARRPPPVPARLRRPVPSPGRRSVAAITQRDCLGQPGGRRVRGTPTRRFFEMAGLLPLDRTELPVRTGFALGVGCGDWLAPRRVNRLVSC